jgi:hypothetical protein
LKKQKLFTSKYSDEKQLLKRYLEIKKINPNYRVKYLKEWEVSVIEAFENEQKTDIGNSKNSEIR